MFAVVSDAWKNVDEATKARYKEQAEELKQAERETESEETPEDAKEETKRKRTSRKQKEGEDEAPAAKRRQRAFRELTGSALFAQENRQKAVEQSRERGMVASRPFWEGG